MSHIIIKFWAFERKIKFLQIRSVVKTFEEGASVVSWRKHLQSTDEDKLA